MKLTALLVLVLTPCRMRGQREHHRPGSINREHHRAPERYRERIGTSTTATPDVRYQHSRCHQ